VTRFKSTALAGTPAFATAISIEAPYTEFIPVAYDQTSSTEMTTYTVSGLAMAITEYCLIMNLLYTCACEKVCFFTLFSPHFSPGGVEN
jgi:hypothetical protein